MSPKKNSTKEAYLQSLAAQNSFLYETVSNIVFNFKFFVSGEHYGQSFKDWERDEILAELNNKLKDFSGKKVHDLLLDKTLEIYTQYPHDSMFKIPDALKFSNVQWARLRLTGQRRLIGFFLCHDKDTDKEAKGANIFYVVFLDKLHQFAPYRKR